MSLATKGLTLGHGPKIIIEDLDFTLPLGQVTALIGPNGSGKSTLMQALAGLALPRSGRVHLDGQPITSIARRKIARRLAYLPQHPVAPEGLDVARLVGQGRYAHLGLWRSFGAEDHRAVEAALQRTDLIRYAERPLSSLSGGERQRAWIASLLAQEANFLLLDEPTSFLDIGHQVEVLDLMKRLCREEGKTVLVAIHDIGHAAAIADHMVVMQNGRIRFSGRPETVIHSDIVNQVFQVRGRFQTGTTNDAPVFVPTFSSSTAKTALEGSVSNLDAGCDA